MLKAGKKKKPLEKYLLIFLFAGHGLMVDGLQNLVYNEFDPNSKFYKLLRAEAKLRAYAEIYPNSYIISIFACCRQNYDPSWMKGQCISKHDYLQMIAESEEIVKESYEKLLKQKEQQYIQEK